MEPVVALPARPPLSGSSWICIRPAELYVLGDGVWEADLLRLVVIGERKEYAFVEGPASVEKGGALIEKVSNPDEAADIQGLLARAWSEAAPRADAAAGRSPPGVAAVEGGLDIRLLRVKRGANGDRFRHMRSVAECLKQEEFPAGGVVLGWPLNYYRLVGNQPSWGVPTSPRKAATTFG